jgi:hypothetical protein
MSKFKQIKKYLILKIDELVLDYLTVERGLNKRKYIWKTKNFRDITQLHIPRLIFIGFVVVMLWKINDKIKTLKSEHHQPYHSKSIREEKIGEERKVRKWFFKFLGD